MHTNADIGDGAAPLAKRRLPYTEEANVARTSFQAGDTQAQRERGRAKLRSSTEQFFKSETSSARALRRRACHRRTEIIGKRRELIKAIDTFDGLSIEGGEWKPRNGQTAHSIS
jgi:hypothetical protein